MNKQTDMQTHDTFTRMSWMKKKPEPQNLLEQYAIFNQSFDKETSKGIVKRKYYIHYLSNGLVNK